MSASPSSAGKRAASAVVVDSSTPSRGAIAASSRTVPGETSEAVVVRPVRAIRSDRKPKQQPSSSTDPGASSPITWSCTGA